MSDKRRRFWIESKIQGAIVRRFVYYWGFAWLFVVGLSFIGASSYSVFTGEMKTSDVVMLALGKLWLPIAMSLVTLPLIIRDYIRLSHRFCGPMVQFRRVVKALANDEKEIRPVNLRKYDYWQDFADDLNLLIEKNGSASGNEAQEAQAQESPSESMHHEPVGV